MKRKQFSYLLGILSILATFGSASHLAAAGESDRPEPPQQAIQPTAESPADAAQAGSETKDTEADAAQAEHAEPVTGAFGIPLGAAFSPDLALKVLREEPQTYRAADKTEQKGTRYWIEPKEPDGSFDTYSVSTTHDGIIYAIVGEYEAADRASKCEVTKNIATRLEEQYGKPRGKGAFGEWYSFRDSSRPLYRGVRLYANRCKRGIYSIHYSDDNVKTAAAPKPAESTETSGR